MYLFIYLFILFLSFGCVRSQLQHSRSSLQHAGSFVVAHWLFAAAHRLLSSCGSQSSLKLWRAGSRVCVLCGQQHAGSLVEACGLSCPAACGILAPRPGIEPASPALEGGFFTTGPPGKSHLNLKCTSCSLKTQKVVFLLRFLILYQGLSGVTFSELAFLLSFLRREALSFHTEKKHFDNYSFIKAYQSCE